MTEAHKPGRDPLNPGQSINVEFKLGAQRRGSYSFYFNVEGR